MSRPNDAERWQTVMGTCGSNGTAVEFIMGGGSSRRKHANARERKGESYDCCLAEPRREGLNTSMLGAGQVEGVVSSCVRWLSRKGQAKPQKSESRSSGAKEGKVQKRERMF